MSRKPTEPPKPTRYIAVRPTTEPRVFREDFENREYPVGTLVYQPQGRMCPLCPETVNRDTALRAFRYHECDDPWGAPLPNVKPCPEADIPCWTGDAFVTWQEHDAYWQGYASGRAEWGAPNHRVPYQDKTDAYSRGFIAGSRSR